MAKKQKKKRVETQFLPRSSTNPLLVRVLGGAGSLALGAGAWEQFGSTQPPVTWTPYLLGGGALLFAAAIWLGTSGDVIVRVGDGGVGVDRGGVTRRIPWYQIEKIRWSGENHAIVVRGEDEAGAALTITIKLKSQLYAAAHVVNLAGRRAAKALDVPESVIETLPNTSSTDGREVELEAIQVVGKRCAKSGKAIAYEPDARVCPNCERVYHKNSVPKKCACGESLAHLRASSDGSEASALEGIDEGEEETAAQEPSIA